MDPLRLGRIIWMVAPGRRGGGKKRPMIVATTWRDIARTKTVAAIVCSTEFDEPPNDGEILLPHDPEGRTITRLKEPTVAVCDWLVSFAGSEIRETGGIVPSEILREICRKAGILYVSER